MKYKDKVSVVYMIEFEMDEPFRNYADEKRFALGLFNDRQANGDLDRCHYDTVVERAGVE